MTRGSMAQAEAPESRIDPTASAEAAIVVPPEIVAQSLGEWFRAWLARLRAGQSGVLPVVLGLVLISIVFTAISPNNLFLSAGNLVNLFQQSAVFMVLAMAEIFVLLLGEIDLATGYTAGVGGVIAVQLVQPVTTKWRWWGAILAALLVCALIGLIQGTLITRLRLSSLIVTLAFSLVLSGVMLILLGLGPFSGYPGLLGQSPNIVALHKLMWGTIDPTLSWIGMVVLVLIVGGILWWSDSRRRRSGLVAPPASLTILKIALIAADVIGGTSLVGGRGKMLHGVLGGLVIGGIYNGLYLLAIDVQWQFIVTGFVLLVAVTIDALSRRSATSGSAARV